MRLRHGHINGVMYNDYNYYYYPTIWIGNFFNNQNTICLYNNRVMSTLTFINIYPHDYRLQCLRY